MKIRNGFVSNSSSSSFVLYGFKANNILPKSNKEREELIKKYGDKEVLKSLEEYGVQDAWWDFVRQENLFGIKDVGFVNAESKTFVGCILADMSSGDGYLKSGEVDLEDMAESIDKLKKIFNITDKPKLYMGTRPC